jgi:hypothetical protein
MARRRGDPPRRRFILGLNYLPQGFNYYFRFKPIRPGRGRLLWKNISLDRWKAGITRLSGHSGGARPAPMVDNRGDMVGTESK